MSKIGFCGAHRDQITASIANEPTFAPLTEPALAVIPVAAINSMSLRSYLISQGISAVPIVVHAVTQKAVSISCLKHVSEINAPNCDGCEPDEEQSMRTKFIVAATLLSTLMLPIAAQAQGTVRGAEEGANAGDRAAGPVGAFIGGVVGAATGTVGGILGVDDRPRFREYALRERRASYRYREDIGVGTVLPESGVDYYDVPAEYHARNYRYAYVNDRLVLVDPQTHRVVEIIE